MHFKCATVFFFIIFSFDLLLVVVNSIDFESKQKFCETNETDETYSKIIRNRRSSYERRSFMEKTFFDQNPEVEFIRPDKMNIIDKSKDSSISKPPQKIRLRGERENMGPSEGRVEIFDELSRLWGVVCDGYWDKEDADVACRQMGFDSGAGRVYHNNHFGIGPWSRADILISLLSCSGSERSIQACPKDPFQLCAGGTAGVTCFLNSGCASGWLSYKGACYKIETTESSFMDAGKSCRSQGGSLAYILLTEENNFLTNVLYTQYKNISSAWIGGYYKQRGQDLRSVWTWQDTIHDLGNPSLWFPGIPPNSEFAYPKVYFQLASCVALQRLFKNPVNKQKYMDVGYFWWMNLSCQMKLPYICQKHVNTGRSNCYTGNGASYRGTVSRTNKGSPCEKWTAKGSVINPQNTPGYGLGEHNYCRNPDNDVGPWCWVRSKQHVFGYCAIDKCDDLPAPTPTSRPLDPSGFGNGNCPSDRFYCPSLMPIKPYAPCLTRTDVCNGKDDCPGKEDENVNQCKKILCNEGQFYCPSSRFCISSLFVCDGKSDCYRAEDERNCSNIDTEAIKEEYNIINGKRLMDFKRTYHTLTLSQCFLKCKSSVREFNFQCLSFNYRPAGEEILYSICELGESTHLITSSSPNQEELLTDENNYNYYYLKETCSDGFRCWNSKCIGIDNRCNGVDDCDDSSDERGCIETKVTFAPFIIRLTGGRGNWEGRVEIRYQGEWGIVCDDEFDILDAQVICNELNFFGASEAISTAWQRFGRGNTNYLLDNLRCLGNETSIQNCNHDGWRRHNCRKDEEAGVVCLATRACASNEFRCLDDRGCIPYTKVCDQIPDCLDGSDERNSCSLNIVLKGPDRNSGLVYVSQGNAMGTICDDEFDELDAAVICRMLGIPGEARPVLDGKYGRGNGLIVLDDLRCNGNENTLRDCPNFQWGRHNCEHKEDIGVECGVIPTTTAKQTTTTTIVTTTSPLVRVPETTRPQPITTTTTTRPPTPPPPPPPTQSCGSRPISQSNQQRVVGGYESIKGAFPWQVGIRKKYPGSDNTFHTCGGTIVSNYWVVSAAHCYKTSKSNFKIRTGDWNNRESDVTEMEYEVEDLLLHPNWTGTGTFDYDLALLKIQPINGRAIEFSDYVQPACLPTSGIEPNINQKCFVSGWGYTNIDFPAILQAANVPLITQVDCLDMYKGGITDRMQCAGYESGGIDTCSGDSGGPLVCQINGRYVLWGATSFGNGCGEQRSPGVYAKVASMVNWVKEKTGVN